MWATISIGFAENFQDRPTLSGLNEMVEQATTYGYAVNERDMVVNRNQNFFPYCGHGQSYFASLQSELEYLPSLYVDHVSGPLNAGKTGFLYFTLATWRVAAELNINGFHRSTDGTTFYYGQMQTGDIIGSWIFEDIEAGFSALKWTYWTNRSITSYDEKSSFGTTYGACISDWATKSWVTNSGSQQYSADATVGYDMYWKWNAHRSRIKDTLTFPANCVNRSMDVYMNSTPTPGYGFYDFDDWDATSGEFFKYDEVASFSGTTYISDWFGNIDTCPWELVPEPPPGQIRDSWNASPYYLAKWDFTY